MRAKACLKKMEKGNFFIFPAPLEILIVAFLQKKFENRGKKMN